MAKEKAGKYGDGAGAGEWKLHLYVTDWAPRCIVAYRNLKKIRQGPRKCDIEVIDLLEKPEIARREDIIAVPTLIKTSPGPRRVLVGDFSREEQVIKGLDMELLK